MTGWFCSWQVEIEWTKYPKLKAVVDKVTSNPGIAKWLKERPKTPFWSVYLCIFIQRELNKKYEQLDLSQSGLLYQR